MMCNLESWTADDEKALLEMQRRREEVMSKRRKVVYAVIEKMDTGVRSVDMDELTDSLITHADAVTLALKPFTRKEGHVSKLDMPDFSKENSDGQS